MSCHVFRQWAVPLLVGAILVVACGPDSSEVADPDDDVMAATVEAVTTPDDDVGADEDGTGERPPDGSSETPPPTEAPEETPEETPVEMQAMAAEEPSIAELLLATDQGASDSLSDDYPHQPVAFFLSGPRCFDEVSFHGSDTITTRLTRAASFCLPTGRWRVVVEGVDDQVVFRDTVTRGTGLALCCPEQFELPLESAFGIYRLTAIAGDGTELVLTEELGPIETRQMLKVWDEDQPTLVVAGYPGEELPVRIFTVDDDQPDPTRIALSNIRELDLPIDGVTQFIVTPDPQLAVCVAPQEVMERLFDVSRHAVCFDPVDDMTSTCSDGVDGPVECEPEVSVSCSTSNDGPIATGEIIDILIEIMPENAPVELTIEHGDGTVGTGDRHRRALFESLGSYDVAVEWSTEGGQGARIACDMVVVDRRAPVVDVSFLDCSIRALAGGSPASVEVGDLLVFEPVEDPPTPGVEYAWSHGDGAIDQRDRSTATYLAAGTYPVTLLWRYQGATGELDCGQVEVFEPEDMNG